MVIMEEIKDDTGRFKPFGEETISGEGGRIATTIAKLR